MGKKPGGILAADESLGTAGKRLEAIGLANTPELRNAWREVMFSAKLTPMLNGVILFEEQLANEKLVKLLTNQGVLVGIKIDQGLDPFEGSDIEQVTKGLDGVEARLATYKKQGASFTKFRSFIHINTARAFPSDGCIRANAKVQAGFALASQNAGLVPIVEPEVDLIGEHSLLECKEASIRVLKTVFEELAATGVYFPGMVLKPSMVTSGKNAQNRATPDAVARATVDVLQSTVPAEANIIAFLSGGQGDEEAYANLSAINVLVQKEGIFEKRRFTFSFSRAAQNTPQGIWKGIAENIPSSQAKFLEILGKMSAASMGTYKAS